MAKLVLVTGGTGYIATELVKQLLEKGYDVRTTVRSKDLKKIATLTALGEALPGNLELFEADLLKDGTFDAAAKGTHFVFHTASPFFIAVKDDPHKELVEPAVHGTRNVLSSVAKSKDTIKRVILTSSVAAIIGNENSGPVKPPKNGDVYTEEDWNTTSTPEKGAYHVSKTKAEEAAWEAAKADGLDLVTILPNFVQGPALSPTSSGTSISAFKAILEGKPGKSGTVYADVRDVARAHILAAEVDSARGRYIVSNTHTSNAAEISGWLQEEFPQYDLPIGEWGGGEALVSNAKAAKELGLQLTPLKQTFCDMARTLIQLGIAEPKKK